MTAPSHIEEIARAMDPLAFEDWKKCPPRGMESMHEVAVRNAQMSRQKRAIKLATLAFNMSAEICAKWHDEQEREAVEAHDAARAYGMGFTSTALREAERHKKYAAAIRALASESEG